VWVALDLMQSMQERMVDRSGPQHAGLLVPLISDFQEVRPTPSFCTGFVISKAGGGGGLGIFSHLRRAGISLLI
jgi:hypothetical protein